MKSLSCSAVALRVAGCFLKVVITAEVALKVAYAVVFRELILKTIPWEATLKVISFELFCFLRSTLLVLRSVEQTLVCKCLPVVFLGCLKNCAFARVFLLEKEMHPRNHFKSCQYS